MATEFEYIAVDLRNDQKKLILKLAPFWVQDEVTQADLNNGRKNRDQQDYLDELIEHLEDHLS